MNLLLDKELIKGAQFVTALERHKFFNETCRRCLDTPLMKKRDCDLLYGYRKPCCKLMDEHTAKKTEDIDKKIIKKGLMKLMQEF